MLLQTACYALGALSGISEGLAKEIKTEVISPALLKFKGCAPVSKSVDSSQQKLSYKPLINVVIVGDSWYVVVKFLFTPQPISIVQPLRLLLLTYSPPPFQLPFFPINTPQHRHQLPSPMVHRSLHT
jgi:hypothetical protein